MLEGLEPNRRDYQCGVEVLLRELDEPDQKILIEALADPKKWSAYGLHAALKLRGLRLNDKAITKHRTGVCSC